MSRSRFVPHAAFAELSQPGAAAASFELRSGRPVVGPELVADPKEGCRLSDVIRAGPLFEALAQLRMRRDQQLERTGSVVQTLDYVLAVMDDAVARAKAACDLASIETAAARVGRSKSTVTDWATKHGQGLWAIKPQREWLIDLEAFVAWYERRYPGPLPYPPSGMTEFFLEGNGE